MPFGGMKDVWLKASKSPQIRGGTLYLAIDIEHLRDAEMFPVAAPETIPDEIESYYCKQGEEKGNLVIPLKEQANEVDKNPQEEVIHGQG